jgi:uncharacterized membrane protein YdjX (TVP38/TMEM64 family)
MKKRNKLILMAIFWLAIVAVLYSQGMITTDINKINEVIGENPFKMRVLFVLLSTVRVLFFIPQTVFIIIGSMLFGPYVGFALSVLSLAISQSIMYAIGRYFQIKLLGKGFLEKNRITIAILEKYGYKVLALGIACPVTPSDLITLLAACIKLNYKKCIAIILMADAPMIFLYGFLGTRIQGTFFFKALAIIVIIFISYYTLVIWNKINSNSKGQENTLH